MNPPIKLVCFDLGGVVVRICRSWEEACGRAGVEVREMVRFRTPEITSRRRELVHLHQTGAIECGVFFEGIAAASGGLYSADEVRRVHAAWIIEDYPGVERVIRRIARVPGVVTACLSNTNASHWSAMLSGFGRRGVVSGGLAALTHRLASHELGAAKPGEEIYRLARERLGAAAGEILFFDDLAENVEAARGAGWRGEVIDHARDTAGQIVEGLRRHGVLVVGDE